MNNWINTWGSVDWMKAPKEYVEKQVDELIANGADVNAFDEYGYTVLMWAVQHDRTEMVQMLINAGAAVNMQDNTGKTALMLTSYNENRHIIKKLIFANADIDMTDNIGRKASDYTSEPEFLERCIQDKLKYERIKELKQLMTMQNSTIQKLSEEIETPVLEPQPVRKHIALDFFDTLQYVWSDIKQKIR